MILQISEKNKHYRSLSLLRTSFSSRRMKRMASQLKTTAANINKG